MSGKIYFLGSGSAWRHATLKELKDGIAFFRRHPALLVELPKGTLLIDAPPTFNDSWNELRYKQLQSGNRIGTIRALFLTHTHFDHVDGLEQVFCAIDKEKYNNPGEEKQFDLVALFGSSYVYHYLRERYSWRFKAYKKAFRLLERVSQKYGCLGDSFRVFNLRHGHVTSWGLRIRSTSYIPDFKSIPENSQKVIKGSRTIIMECNSLDEGSPSHVDLAEAIAFGRVFHRSGLDNLILTHLGDTFPIQQRDIEKLFKDRAKGLPFRLVPSFDFMELDLI